MNLPVINSYTVMVGLAILVGVLGGLGAVAFRYLILLFQHLFYASAGDVVTLTDAVPWFRILLAPVIGGILVGPLVFFFAREAKGHGVPEVIEAVVLKGGRIRKRLVAVKSLASAICIASGGSVGREGPIVQIASSIGSALGQFFKVPPARMKILVGCGAAAGIAATFNAPIAGSLFALEVIMGDFGIASFGPVVLSSVMATAVSRAFLGDYPAFIIPQFQLVSPLEIPFYMILGLLSGLVALAFTVTLYKAEDAFDALKIPEYSKAALGGLCIGVIGVFYPHVMGVGYDTIQPALWGEMAWWLLFLLVFLKLLATSLTIGSGGSGGIFAPSLFMGAMAGGGFGSLLHSIWPDLVAPSGAYALVGMGAVVAGTTHAPIQAMLIVFEMTGDYKIILPLMLACTLSTLLSTALKKESIYTLKLIRRGVNIRAGQDVEVLRSISVREIMKDSVETVHQSVTLKQLLEMIPTKSQTTFPVVDSSKNLTGILSFEDFRNYLFDKGLEYLLVAQELATENVITIFPEETLEDAFKKIGSKGIDTLPVVSPENPKKLLGIVFLSDMVKAYNKALISQSIRSVTGYSDGE
ncbi:MAG: chloride channel protein [Deltaproteobacteria bacterium]|nr:chloride channel protein [Deltaproteobacteria bacterium]